MPPHDKTLNMAMQSTGKDAEQLARKLSTNVHRAVRADRTNHCRKYLETVDTNRKAQRATRRLRKGCVPERIEIEQIHVTLRRGRDKSMHDAGS